MFDYKELMALKELVVGDEQQESEATYYKGSMLSPADISADPSDSKKQIAKPYTKIQAKVGQKYKPKEKEAKETVAKPSKKQEQKAPKNSIWDQKEVPVLPVIKDDPRPKPQYEIMHRQIVGTEDVYLGLNQMDPSSTKCQEITIKIKLPGVQHKQIQLDLTSESMVLQTPKHYLHQYFPYKVRDKQTKAKWVSDKQVLQLYMPIVRQF